MKFVTQHHKLTPRMKAQKIFSNSIFFESEMRVARGGGILIGYVIELINVIDTSSALTTRLTTQEHRNMQVFSLTINLEANHSLRRRLCNFTYTTVTTL